MAYGSYPDAHNGGIHRSFREPLLGRVLQGENFRPLCYLYSGQWQQLRGTELERPSAVYLLPFTNVYPATSGCLATCSAICIHHLRG